MFGHIASVRCRAKCMDKMTIPEGCCKHPQEEVSRRQEQAVGNDTVVSSTTYAFEFDTNEKTQATLLRPHILGVRTDRPAGKGRYGCYEAVQEKEDHEDVLAELGHFLTA